MSKKSRNRHSSQAVANKKSSQARPVKGKTSPQSFQWWWVAAAIGVVAIVVGIVWVLQQNDGQASNAAANEISVAEAFAKYEQGVFLLDVRDQEEWDSFHAPDTTLIPLDQLPDRVNELPKDQEIVVICRSGNRSQEGRDILLKAGFTNVSSMAGGLNEWRSAGYPTVSGP
jgi:rhodanese-related sulfurtransferase